jgi:hypothetical protein
MNKPTIEIALQQRIPLPWKQSTCDGPPSWKVERQRPEDFTAEIYQKLKKYGMKEAEIRELFYVTNENWVRLKQQVGAVPPPEDSDEPVVGRPKKQYKNCFPNAKKTADNPAPVITPDPPWATVVPKDRKKVELEPSTAEDPDGLNYQDRHNLGIHTPTEPELEDVFRPEDNQPIPFVLSLTLRDCAEKLVKAIDAREAADKQIEFYTSEIRRLA